MRKRKDCVSRKKSGSDKKLKDLDLKKRHGSLQRPQKLKESDFQKRKDCVSKRKHVDWRIKRGSDKRPRD